MKLQRMCVGGLLRILSPSADRPLSGLAPEIAHFRTRNDPPMVRKQAPLDWYIKGSSK